MQMGSTLLVLCYRWCSPSLSRITGMNLFWSIGPTEYTLTKGANFSDRTRERGFHIVVGFLLGIVGLLWLALAKSGVSRWVLYCKSDEK
jgi:hypothetical protein